MSDGSGRPDLSGLAAAIAAMEIDFIVSPWSAAAKLTGDNRHEMTVTAGTENEQMTLPAPPTTKLIEETRYSNVVSVGCDGCNEPYPRKDSMFN